jgi:hypothetical protein
LPRLAYRGKRRRCQSADALGSLLQLGALRLAVPVPRLLGKGVESMTLYLKPPGRGNWTEIVMQISTSRTGPVPVEVHKGDRITIAGRSFRVCRVGP